MSTTEKQTSPLVLVIVLIITVGLVVGGFIVFQRFTNPNPKLKPNPDNDTKPEEEEIANLKKAVEELKAIELKKQKAETEKVENLFLTIKNPMRGATLR